jgi:outer membrane receptor for monomeric catechols
MCAEPRAYDCGLSTRPHEHISAGPVGLEEDRADRKSAHEGVEAGVSGDIRRNWHVIAGFARQNAEIITTTSAAPAGAIVPLVPEQTYSLWNRFDLRLGTGVGLGIVHPV